MSELTTRFIDDTYAEYSNTGKHELAQIYIKTEADKVIAEKDAEIAQLQAMLEERIKQAGELKDRWFWAYPTESVDCDGITGSAHEVYSKSEVDEVIAEKDKEIAELKAKIIKSKELADGIRCDIEKVKADAAETLALLEERNKQIGELKAENERLKATPEEIMKEIFDKMLIYPHDMVRLEDAYRLAVSLRKTKRALYKACANWAHFAVAFFSSYATKEKWSKMFSKCLKKAEEHK